MLVQCFHTILRRPFQQWYRRKEVHSLRTIPSPVVQAANMLFREMGIWQVENSIEIKVHMARWHDRLQMYRGYLLCSDPSGRTFLLDTHTWSYLSFTRSLLLQIEGIEQAKRFVDILCCLQAWGKTAGCSLIQCPPLPRPSDWFSSSPDYMVQ